MPPADDEPLVSVLTPSFNQARWLGDNVRSVGLQTYRRIEHIVMDGASTDGSVAVLEQADATRLRWFSEPDRGQSDALNKAFRASSGTLIGWLNSDDAYFSTDVVERVVEVFRQHPEVAVVYGHALLVNADGLVLQAIWTPPFSRSLLRLHDFIAQPAAFVRRSALGDAMVDDSYDYTMDYELWLRLAARSPFRRLDRILAIDRHHPDRKSYVMAGVGRDDHARLERAYGVAGGRPGALARKAWKILSRAAGTRLAKEALATSPAFRRSSDGLLALVVRQLLTPRAWMPTGSPTGPVSSAAPAVTAGAGVPSHVERPRR